MRICLYTGTALPKLGGQEAVVDALARAYLKMGHEPFVMAPRPRHPVITDDGRLPYPVLRHPRFFSTKRLVGWYRRWLVAAHRRHRFDILHCHDVYPTGYLAALSQRQLNIPIVITSHGGDIRQGNRRLAKTGMEKRFVRAVRAADALISIGAFTRDAFLRLGADEKKIVSIPNGVDRSDLAHPVPRPAELDPAIAPGRYVLFLGRLAVRKGVDTLLDAWALLPPSEFLLVIAGSGDLQSSIERQIEQAALTGRVRLVGRVAGKMKTYLLQNALCTVMPSRQWEAFPLVLLESFAAGRPVIGSAIAGLKDLIEHERTGFLVPPESAGDLADAIGRLIAQPRPADEMGRCAAEIALKLDWSAVAAEHLQLYARLLAS